MAGAIPDSKAFEPTGVLEEIVELGLDPKVYRCCAKPVQGEVSGCQFWNICERPYKGGPPPDPSIEDQDPNEIGGPHHHGVLYITAEGRTVQDVRSCFQHAILVNEHQQSGNVYEIVADEGEVILIKGTAQVPVNKNNPGGKQKAAPFTREELVPRFPRPKEVFHEKVYEMKVRDTIAKANKRKQMKRALGDQADGLLARQLGNAQAAQDAKDTAADAKANRGRKGAAKKEDGDAGTA